MQRPKIFVIQASGETSEAILRMIVSAAAETNALVATANTDYVEDVQLREHIHGHLESCDLVIADVTDANPHVMYELGFAQAQKKAVILIANSGRAIPFDLSGINVLIYDLMDMAGFLPRMRRQIELALKQPEDFMFSTTSQERGKRQKVFISYSHRDREYLDRLLVHMKPLERDGLIEIWVDTRLRAGDRWKREIEEALHRATVAILLISADFLASDFIINDELPPLLRIAEEKGTRVIPFIIRPCRFTRDKSLRHFQALNDPQHPLIRLSPGEQESLYDLLSSEVEKTLQRG